MLTASPKRGFTPYQISNQTTTVESLPRRESVPRRTILGDTEIGTGFTLMELIVGAVIATIIALGMMAAFVTSRKVSVDATSTVEATAFAQQTLEALRTNVACDPPWFNSVNCNYSGPLALTPDSLPAAPPSGTAESMLTYNATRTYQVTPADCDGDGTLGDCLLVKVNVDWTQPK